MNEILMFLIGSIIFTILNILFIFLAGSLIIISKNIKGRLIY